MEVIHIYPENDLREHNTDGYTCDCKPELQFDDDSDAILVLHNSFWNTELLDDVNKMSGL